MSLGLLMVTATFSQQGYASLEITVATVDQALLQKFKSIWW
jgi:hypothetical protein